MLEVIKDIEKAKKLKKLYDKKNPVGGIKSFFSSKVKTI